MQILLLAFCADVAGSVASMSSTAAVVNFGAPDDGPSADVGTAESHFC